jgi:hypothetical protein
MSSTSWGSTSTPTAAAGVHQAAVGHLECADVDAGGE